MIVRQRKKPTDLSQIFKGQEIDRFGDREIVQRFMASPDEKMVDYCDKNKERLIFCGRTML